MKTFKDTAGRTWLVQVNAGTLRAVRDNVAGANFGDFLNLPNLVRRLRFDDVYLAEVAYFLASLQGAKDKPPLEEFLSAMAGDVLDPAYAAVTEGLADFFRSPAQRTAVGRIVAAVGELAGWHVTRIAATPSSSAADGPASSASTPTDAPSANSPG